MCHCAGVPVVGCGEHPAVIEEDAGAAVGAAGFDDFQRADALESLGELLGGIEIRRSENHCCGFRWPEEREAGSGAGC